MRVRGGGGGGEGMTVRQTRTQEKCRWCGAVLYEPLASKLSWRCRACKGHTYNPKMLSYHGTEKSPASTLSDITRIFEKFSTLVSSYQIAADPDKRLLGVEFVVRVRMPGREVVTRTQGSRVRLRDADYGYSEYTPGDYANLSVGKHDLLPVFEELVGQRVAVWIADEPVNLVDFSEADVRLGEPA